MALRRSAAPEAARDGRGHAVRHISRGAFHNPARDVVRLGGLATVFAPTTDDPPVMIGAEEFIWTVPTGMGFVRPERNGSDVRPLVAYLSFVRRVEARDQYFRSSPQEIPEVDFRVLAEAIES
jgi:hypothetical protein